MNFHKTQIVVPLKVKSTVEGGSTTFAYLLQRTKLILSSAIEV